MRIFVRTVEDAYDKHYCYLRFESSKINPNWRYATIVEFDLAIRRLKVVFHKNQTLGSIALDRNVAGTSQTLKFGIRRHMQSRIKQEHNDYIETQAFHQHEGFDVYIPDVIMNGLVPHDYSFTAKIIPEKRKMRSFKRNAKTHNTPVMIPLVEEPVNEQPVIKPEPINNVTIIKMGDLKNYLAIMQENSLDNLRIPRTNIVLKT